MGWILMDILGGYGARSSTIGVFYEAPYMN